MKRPLSVTLIGILFILAGISGIVYHAAELNEAGEQPEAIWVFFLRIVAIVGGAFVLKKRNWARWLMVAWISYHVVLSFYHSAVEIAMHTAVLILVLFALFNPKANRYFRREVRQTEKAI